MHWNPYIADRSLAFLKILLHDIKSIASDRNISGSLQDYIVGMIYNLKNFDQVEIYLKSNDKNYEIKSLLAALEIDNLNKCLTKKNKINYVTIKYSIYNI